jgi:uncharacterized protein involved in exopolysaccharide biosynthesis
LTLEQLTEKLRSYGRPLRRRWWLVLIFILLGGGILLGYGLTKETIYISQATFMPEKQGKSTVSLDPLASLLGGGGGGGSGGDELSGVLTSRYLSEQVAADTITYRSASRLTADALLEYYLVERFYPGRIVLGAPDINEMEYEGKVISAGKMIRSSLTVNQNEYGFLQMKFALGEPELVEAVSKACIKHLKSYLVEKKTEKDSLDYYFYKRKADSVKNLIEENARFIARFADRALFSTRNSDRVEAEKRKLENDALLQVLKQYELSREKSISQIQQNTPTIQVLDEPKPPFLKLEPRLAMHLAGGIFLGFLLAFLWLTRKLWKADFRDLLEKALE